METLPNLVCRTSSRARHLILLLQAINPESVRRQGNSLGPVPRGHGEGREMLRQLNAKRDHGFPSSAFALRYVVLRRGKFKCLHQVYINIMQNTTKIKPRRSQPKAVLHLFLLVSLWGTTLILQVNKFWGQIKDRWWGSALRECVLEEEGSRPHRPGMANL